MSLLLHSINKFHQKWFNSICKHKCYILYNSIVFQYYFYNVVPFEYHFINNCQVSVGYFALQQMPIGKNIMISKYFYKYLLVR